ncbi:tRNA(m(1)G37)methyltransferase [Blyttiomyces sp. JEL0837]|nr:tRNA(m(1)G37)methyltransferase [Blyttiomyces sp. JEL0837]
MSRILPPLNKGINKLQKDLFRKSVDVVALKVTSQACHKAMKTLSGSLLDLPRLRNIVDENDQPARKVGKQETKGGMKLILLDLNITEPNVDSLPAQVKEFADQNGAELVKFQVHLDYDYWTSDNLEVPGSFELVGHIAHMNLRSEYLPYKSLIGEIILDKNKHVRTVVNKTDSIDHTFRFFKMELLAGENQMETEVKENNCRFQFDFSQVYWNSRLQAEHERLVQSFDIAVKVCDVMAGVGPFALPAAKNQQCLVFANDLNPNSYRYLCKNIATNKVDHLVKPYNLDGREFIKASLACLNDADVRKEMAESAIKLSKLHVKKADGKKGSPPVLAYPHEFFGDKFEIFEHYIMNLPATAIEFLARAQFVGLQATIGCASGAQYS